jgi:ATP-binding cassette, subfamily B, bacterial PglK
MRHGRSRRDASDHAARAAGVANGDGANGDGASVPLMTQAPPPRTAILPTARKVVEIVDPRDRWKLFALFAAMVVTGLLQMAGVASIMPFIGLAANPDGLSEQRFLGDVYEALGSTSERTFLLGLGVAVIVLIATANAFMAFTLWMTLRFVWTTHHRISERLLDGYLRKPYEFYLGRNTAGLSKTLLSEVKEVIRGVLVPGMDILARAVVALFVIALLVLVDPLLATLVALALGASYALVYLMVRRKQRELGYRRLGAQTLRYKAASEAFGGIKDVKVLGREGHFVSRFRQPSLVYSRANASNAIVSELPRFALETIAFGGILVVLLYLLQTRDTLVDVLPLIALYAFAGNRLMPAFQQIFAGLTKIRFHAPALDDLHADLHGLSEYRFARAHVAAPGGEEAAVEPLPFERELRFSDVSFAYPGSATPALTGVDLVVPVASMVGFVGPTGAGKTTIIDLLLGLFAPTEGTILVDDVALDGDTAAAWRRRLGYVPQTIYLCDDTVTRNIAYGIRDEQIDHAAVERAACAAHLEDFIRALPDEYETLVGERGVRLSGGERQRLGIARALYHDPDVLVLDEATSALDTATEESVLQAVTTLAERRTIVMIAHRLSTVRACDVIYLLENGTVTAHGTYDELSTTNAAFRALARIA